MHGQGRVNYYSKKSFTMYVWQCPKYCFDRKSGFNCKMLNIILFWISLICDAFENKQILNILLI